MLKSRVAELRAYGDSSSTTIDGKSYAGKVELVLYSFSNGRTRTLDTHLPVTVNTNMMYEGRFKYLDAGYLQEHDAVFDVEAGDVDGDGVDELFVYAGCYVDENGVRKAVVDMYDLEGGNWKQSVVKIDAGNAEDYHAQQGRERLLDAASVSSCRFASGRRPRSRFLR